MHLRAAAALAIACAALACSKTRERPDPEARIRRTCVLPEGEILSVRAEVAAQCDALVAELVRVRQGGALILRQGSRLRFAKGAGIVIEGGALIADGTPTEPVELTSAQPTPRPGDWLGVSFEMTFLDDAARAELYDGGFHPPPTVVSTLHHVTVDYAGGVREEEPSAVRLSPWYDAVDVDHLTVRHSATLGLFVLWDRSVRRFESVRVEDAVGDAASIPTALVPKLTTEAASVVRIHELVKTSTFLARREKPYIVDAHQPRFGVEATTAPVTLEIESGARVLLPGGATITIDGASARATFIARDVVFEAAEQTPAVALWGGIAFYGDAAADLERVTIRHAGAMSDCCPHFGVVRLPQDDSNVKITSSIFRDNMLPAIASWRCAAWESPALKNESIGRAMCIN